MKFSDLKPKIKVRRKSDGKVGKVAFITELADGWFVDMPGEDRDIITEKTIGEWELVEDGVLQYTSSKAKGQLRTKLDEDTENDREQLLSILKEAVEGVESLRECPPLRLQRVTEGLAESMNKMTDKFSKLNTVSKYINQILRTSNETHNRPQRFGL